MFSLEKVEVTRLLKEATCELCGSRDISKTALTESGSGRCSQGKQGNQRLDSNTEGEETYGATQLTRMPVLPTIWLLSPLAKLIIAPFVDV